MRLKVHLCRPHVWQSINKVSSSLTSAAAGVPKQIMRSQGCLHPLCSPCQHTPHTPSNTLCKWLDTSPTADVSSIADHNPAHTPPVVKRKCRITFEPCCQPPRYLLGHQRCEAVHMLLTVCHASHMLVTESMAADVPISSHHDQGIAANSAAQ